MTKVLARIVIDSEDWELTHMPSEDMPSVLVRKVVTTRARPFNENELNLGVGTQSDQFFL
jgi:hypothetical protein